MLFVDVNTAVPLVDQSDEAEVLATRPMSYVLAVDNGKMIQRLGLQLVLGNIKSVL